MHLFLAFTKSLVISAKADYVPSELTGGLKTYQLEPHCYFIVSGSDLVSFSFPIYSILQPLMCRNSEHFKATTRWPTCEQSANQTKHVAI